MRAYHLAAILALGFWQVAPVQITRSPGGRFRLAIAGATGQWEDYEPASVDCYGNQTAPARSSAVGASSYGARADLFLDTSGSRLTLVAGRSAADSSSVGAGPFWGVEAAFEGRKFGASVGYRHAGDELLPTYPGSPEGLANLSFAFRAGRLDGVHSRAEFRPLSETPSLAGELRVGMGYGQGRQRQVSAFVGLVLGSVESSDDVRAAGFCDLGIPVAQTADLLVRAVFGPGHSNPNWGLGAGLRVNWGR
jgi:hypothetical protein